MEPQDLRERVIGALGAVLAVAVVIGVVVGVVAYVTVRATGLGEDETAPAAAPASPGTSASPSAEPSTPSRATTSSAAPSPTPSPTESSTPSPTSRAAGDHKSRHRRHAARRAAAPTLSGGPHRVASMGGVDLHGHYRGHAGTRLLVQRRLGHGPWQRFPVSVTVRGGTFHTWVVSGRPGRNDFRVLDPSTHRASAPVTVLVG